jgi:Ca-activated chloride channel family protein
MSRQVRTAVLAAVAGGLPALLSAQAKAPHALPRFGAAVDVVNLSVTVADADRKHVTGLESRDFRVLEDGVPQELTVFDRQSVPLQVAILVDASLSMQPRMPAVQAAALRLVHALRPQDTARVVQFNHRQAIVQDFTGDQALLETAVRSIRPEGATSLYNAIYVSLRSLEKSKGEDPRRRAVVVLSDGADTTSLLSDDQVLDAARRAEVTIYAVGLGIADAALSVAGPDASRARFFLNRLATESGGEAFFPRSMDELDGVYGRIAEELSMQYSLGYVSSNGLRDGKWRRVTVQAPRGAVIRHRAGYYAARARAPRTASASVPRVSTVVAGGH